jgi:hypothetical protein
MLDAYALTNFQNRLSKMTNDEVLEQYHLLEGQIGKVPDAEKDLVLHKHLSVEAELMKRFGVGQHLVRYRAKYPTSG